MELEGERVVVKEPFKLELQKFSIDTGSIGDYEVIIKNHYSAISAGTELTIYDGTNPRAYEANSWNKYPFQPGYAGLGEVAAVGKAVTGLNVGDPVFHHSHHASYDRRDARYFPYVKISSDLMRPDVSLLRFAAIVLTGGVRQTRLEIGDNIAIFGLGVIGQMAAQLYRLSGASIIAFDPVESRRKVAEQIGACDAVYDPFSTKPEEILAVKTGNVGIDVLVEATGRLSVLANNIKAVRPMGQVIQLGLPHGKSTDDMTEFFRHVFLYWITLTGALERNRYLTPTEYLKHSYVAEVNYLIGLLKTGKLKTEGMVSHLIRPSEFQSAYDGLLGPYSGRPQSSTSDYMGVVVDWRES
jgi:threonine dehydrogenase-like Zn-dependent dehydrogenase